MKGKVRNAFEGQRSDWNGEMHWHRQRLASASPIQTMTTTDKHQTSIHRTSSLLQICTSCQWLVNRFALFGRRAAAPSVRRSKHRLHVLRFSPSISSTQAITSATSDSRTISYDRNAALHPFPTKDRVAWDCRQCPSSSWSHLAHKYVDSRDVGCVLVVRATGRSSKR